MHKSVTLKCTQGVCADRASAIDTFARHKTSPGMNLEMVYCNGINANALANQMHRHFNNASQYNQVSTLQHFTIWPGARAHSTPIRNRVSMLVQLLFSSGASTWQHVYTLHTSCMHSMCMQWIAIRTRHTCHYGENDMCMPVSQATWGCNLSSDGTQSVHACMHNEQT